MKLFIMTLLITEVALAAYIVPSISRDRDIYELSDSMMILNKDKYVRLSHSKTISDYEGSSSSEGYSTEENSITARYANDDMAVSLKQLSRHFVEDSYENADDANRFIGGAYRLNEKLALGLRYGEFKDTDQDVDVIIAGSATYMLRKNNYLGAFINSNEYAGGNNPVYTVVTGYGYHTKDLAWEGSFSYSPEVSVEIDGGGTINSPDSKIFSGVFNKIWGKFDLYTLTSLQLNSYSKNSNDRDSVTMSVIADFEYMINEMWHIGAYSIVASGITDDRENDAEYKLNTSEIGLTGRLVWRSLSLKATVGTGSTKYETESSGSTSTSETDRTKTAVDLTYFF